MTHEGLQQVWQERPRQLYRYDRVEGGRVTLTVESSHGGVIECKTGKVREMYTYRQKHYPNAHNYRHHINGEDGCPTCDKNSAVPQGQSRS